MKRKALRRRKKLINMLCVGFKVALEIPLWG
jgi:hypothetical protein